MKTQDTHRNHPEVLVGLVLLLLLAAGGSAWWIWRTKKPQPKIQQPISTKVEKLPSDTSQSTVIPKPINKIKPTVIPKPINTTKPTVIPTPINTIKPTIIPTPVTKTVPPITTAVTQIKPQSYWLKVNEIGDILLVPQQIEVESEVSEEVALKAAFNKLLNTRETSNLSSTIPPGTRLLSLQVTKSGIYVNLSQEFASGGGTTSMIYRVAQIVYTASSLDSQAKVYLSVEGRLLDENNPLGGEGLIFTEPLTREQFAKDFSISGLTH
ncbi:MAG: GerMN domain-containing protein [Nostocaceae cyanobacterium]|nr:GerMN domain-containing protein [Nostocaceae cyanobacterium]